MKTPTGGDRSTQWVIQSRRPATEESVVTEWARWTADPTEMATSARSRSILDALRERAPEREWRAIRIESVQRVEDW